MNKTLISIIVIVLFVVGVVVLGNIKSQKVQSATDPETNLTMQVLQTGSGDSLKPGDTAVVHYTGRLVDGVVFDSSLTRGMPFEFQYGAGNVIQGWEIGLQNMKVGEKRMLTIPPQFGYGDQAVGPIPPNSTLIFEVELIEIK